MPVNVSGGLANLSIVNNSFLIDLCDTVVHSIELSSNNVIISNELTVLGDITSESLDLSFEHLNTRLTIVDSSLIALGSGGNIGNGQDVSFNNVDINGNLKLSDTNILGDLSVNLTSNVLTIDANNVSYSTIKYIAPHSGDISDIYINNFINNAHSIIYFQAHASGNNIKGYTTHPLTNVKKNFADNIDLPGSDIAVLTISRIHNVNFMSVSLFK